ncbi:polysaccharide deacetylase family protein [Paenibacillus harenae]|uniref:Peptidoglycan/xylan/chitin deacetylase (PgdA/CDA1 family) n=1 Tax=Paenibacillus harenae TaxID=306543 RepID=A0ABT9U184_PAEHA|nr:polysaccharide deacetylase family protein [Paenibacillus harenae]MDQ0113383.1 peptidoglycan/xylan/chitin deacetylase (PgdA/CDA1 family) [Paenibacillus harenae]
MARTKTIAMIELSSIEQTGTGFRMEVIITRNQEPALCIIAIDEFTYNEIIALHPLTAGRVRMSLYAKWDPFRNRHYSSLIKMDERFGETLYFACAESYAVQLEQLRLSDSLPEKPAAVAEKVEEAPQQRKSVLGRVRATFIGKLALRLAMVVCLFFLFASRTEDGMFSNHADALSPASMDTVLDENTAKSLPTEAGPVIEETIPVEVKKEETPKLGYKVLEADADKYTYSVPKGYVALTFDDGPSEYTEQIVDILKEYDIAATFLFVGLNVKHDPEAAAYAVDNGMAVGNHSWAHNNLTKSTDEENTNSIARVNELIESESADEDTVVNLFRPPYGAINDDVKAVVKREQMKVLMWNRDPVDWKAKTKRQILSYFKQKPPSGGIYVMHEKKLTVEALPEIIQYLKSKQLKFVIFK